MMFVFVQRDHESLLKIRTQALANDELLILQVAAEHPGGSPECSSPEASRRLLQSFWKYLSFTANLKNAND